MKQFRIVNIVTGWIVFLIAAITYILTIEPTASFWDCGEFIATAYKLQVGHPPGAPTFMIISRFFSLFAGNPENVAYMINVMSGLASAFTILFLYWTIIHLAKKIAFSNSEPTQASSIAVIASGVVGALAYTWSDTFWFSAVEAEVYSSSSLFTAIVFWAILKWENVFDQPYANRWIILIAYLIGLSIGVHLLNLLAIPAIVFVFYFKKYKPSTAGVLVSVAVSLALLGGIMYVLIPGIVKVAAAFERTFVNGFGLPYKSGVLFYIILLIALIIIGLYFTSKKKKVIANTIILAFTVILIGYSSYAIVIIRSLANPPMDQNNPETVFNLLSYLNRDQYGDNPLFYGHFYNAPIVGQDEKNPSVVQKDGKYIDVNYKPDYKYDERFLTIFPRMYSSQAKHIKAYKEWANIKGRPVKVRGQDGKTKTEYVPTFGENLRFFFNYQIGHMYLRYFLWNFAGRQNDIQGHGEITKGNWISGIPFVDNSRLGPQEKLPDYLKNNAARNKYFFLPLILGLVGLIYQFKKQEKDGWVITLLFLLTGLAIVVYLNQYPFQPRERDYAYAGSFYAFSIWIGLGVLGIYDLLKKYISPTPGAIASGVVSLVAVPLLLVSQNWDDHSRAKRYTARDFAYNYLNSCEENAIIFTNGDNDTFPLWYIQDVEGVRTDVRVVNLSYLSTDWYIDQMKRHAYKSEPVPFSMTKEHYEQGKRDYIPLDGSYDKYVDLKKVIDFVKSDNPKTKYRAQDRELDFIPTKKFSLSVDSAKLIENGTVKPEDADKMLKSIDWKINKSYLLKSDLMVLDLLASNDWERPIYFAITVGSDSYQKLEPFFQIEGLAYRVVPFKTTNQRGFTGRIDTEILYDNMMNKFRWGNINDPDVYLDENNQRMLMNFRSNFSRLGKKLLEEGDNKRAMEVADKCIELMPHEKIPYNYFNIQIAEIYFMLNENEKGADIIDKIKNVSEQELDFYFSLDNEKSRSMDDEIKRSIYMFQELLRITKANKMDDLTKDLEEKFELYYSIYTGKA